MSRDPYEEHGFTRKGLIEAIRLGEGRFTKRELARALGISGDQRIGLKDALRALEAEGAIRKTGAKAYDIAGGLPPVSVLEVYDRDVDGEFLCRPVKKRAAGPGHSPGARTQIGAAAAGRRGRPGARQADPG